MKSLLMVGVVVLSACATTQEAKKARHADHGHRCKAIPSDRHFIELFRVKGSGSDYAVPDFKWAAECKFVTNGADMSGVDLTGVHVTLVLPLEDGFVDGLGWKAESEFSPMSLPSKFRYLLFSCAAKCDKLGPQEDNLYLDKPFLSGWTGYGVGHISRLASLFAKK